ncbi:MAG: hypothetical protein ACLR2G_08345 [Phascolarctobacterium faecium]
MIAGNRQQRKKILLVMEWLSKTKKFLLSLRMIWENPVDAKASLVAACYSEDDCFYWGKELENFAAWQHMCNEYKPGSSALLHALEVYELPKNKTK